MKPLDLNFICQTLGILMPSENQPVSRIVTDSRDIQDGDVFSRLPVSALMRMTLLKMYWWQGQRQLWSRAKIARL